jgi:hypothetical protein
MVLNFEQRIFIVKHYFASKSLVLSEETFPNEAVLNKTVVHVIAFYVMALVV